jgi:hypothetical protein
MAYTLDQLIQKCVLRLSMVGGTGVQVYSEDILGEMIQERFDELFDRFWWEDYMNVYVGTLHTDGTVDEDIRTTQELDRFTDIQHIHHQTKPNPLLRIDSRSNRANYLKTSSPIYIAPIAGDKVFQLLPYGDVGDAVTISFRKRPTAAFIGTDEILLDNLLLIYGACYDYLEDDAGSQGAIAKFQDSYNARLTQLNSLRNEQGIPLMPGRADVPDDWQYVR